VGHIGSAKVKTIDFIERPRQPARFFAGDDPLVFAAHPAEDELKRAGMRSAGGVDFRGGSKIRLMIGNARGIDLAKSLLFS